MDNIQLDKVIEGDVNAYRYFIDKYKDMSFSIAMSIVKKEFLAEEVVQDSFLKAYQGLNKFKRDAKFSTWLYKIVLNESLKKIRKKKLETRESDIADITDINISVTNDSINQLKEKEQKKYIQLALSKLNSRESLILKLHYLNEKSINEIEKITDLKTSNIKVILHRARKNLYTILNDYLKQEIHSIL